MLAPDWKYSGRCLGHWRCLSEGCMVSFSPPSLSPRQLLASRKQITKKYKCFYFFGSRTGLLFKADSFKISMTIHKGNHLQECNKDQGMELGKRWDGILGEIAVEKSKDQM